MARVGAVAPDTEVAHSETGPWRPARQIKGLVFLEPELPPLEPSSPFDSFADPVTPAVPRDDGILLEEPRPASEPEPEPDISFDEAPRPATVPEPSLPGPESPLVRLLGGTVRGANQYPEYAALRAYGWLFRIGGFLTMGVGTLSFVGALASLLWIDEGFRHAAFAAGATGLLGGFLLGFLMLVPGDAILAFVDLVQDARRQRIAAERAVVLLDSARPGKP